MRIKYNARLAQLRLTRYAGDIIRAVLEEACEGARATSAYKPFTESRVI